MLRFLELSWLSVAIVLAGITGFRITAEGFNGETFLMLCITAIAGIMYSVRKSQRKKSEKISRPSEKDQIQG
jgi:hypothetical protein